MPPFAAFAVATALTVVAVAAHANDPRTSIADRNAMLVKIGMAELVSSIQRVTQIMNEISAVSAEQSAGVRLAGDSVTQMDRGTQQNAALVEQGAAAAESLREQAGELVRSVAVFRF